MANIQIEINTGEAQIWLRSVQIRIRRAVAIGIRRSLTEIGKTLRQNIRAAAPVRTGRLKRSIRSRRARVGSEYQIQIRFIDRNRRSVFYGYITNATGIHRGWADGGVDQSIPKVRAILELNIKNALADAGIT